MMSINIRAKMCMITRIVHHLKKGDLSELETIVNQPKTKACDPQHVFLEIVQDPSGTFTLFHLMRLALKADDYVVFRDWMFRHQSQHTPRWGMLLRTVKNLFLSACMRFIERQKRKWK